MEKIALGVTFVIMMVFVAANPEFAKLSSPPAELHWPRFLDPNEPSESRSDVVPIIVRNESKVAKIVTVGTERREIPPGGSITIEQVVEVDADGRRYFVAKKDGVPVRQYLKN